jgi:hypothetical protein
MKIFSEDEAMLSNSCGSDLSKSLAGNSIFDDDLHFGNTKHAKVTTKPSNSEPTEENSTSPKNRRMSFREKFRIFTSPNSGRKTESNDCSEAQPNNISKDESTKKNCQNAEEVAAAAAGVNDADLRNAFPRDQMLRPVKSAESLTTATINHPQRTQSDRVACITTKPGIAATLLASENKSNETEPSSGIYNQSSVECSQNIKVEDAKRNISYRDYSNQKTESTSMLHQVGSRQLSSVELDEVGELEQVAQAVTNLKNSIISNSRTSSPKCHSRSSSHDSYFDKKLASSVVLFKMEDDVDGQDSSVESPGKNINK